jgi:hypothetical protein
MVGTRQYLQNYESFILSDPFFFAATVAKAGARFLLLFSFTGGGSGSVAL